jgi:acetolactate synthase-1/2/3 large subunit
MWVSNAVIDSLVGNGIDTIFGNPGKQSLPLNQAIGNSGEIEFVVARHETAVSHQAWGYAQTSGRPAATVVIPGPGDMNAMNGLKNALNDCAPMIHIAVETDPQFRGTDGLHEQEPDTYDNVVKENIHVTHPKSTVVEMERAIAVAMTPPRGPVRVGIPKGYLRMDVPLADAGDYSRTFYESVSDDDVAAATELLAGSNTPVILAGGGVRAAGATNELIAIAERLGAPVVTTYKGKGVIPDSHPLAVGALSGSSSPELRRCVEESDIALAVGTDFDPVAYRSWSIEIPEALVHVTLNGDDLGTGYDPDVGIVADAAAALRAIDEELAGRLEAPANGEQRATFVANTKEDRLKPLLDGEPPYTSVDALRMLREAIPNETIIAMDAGGFRVWALNTFNVYGPRSYVTPGSWATMGTGLPSGIGAQIANPDGDVMVITGDGGLMMCVHELHTAVIEELPITLIVLNNHDYAIITEEAERDYDLEEGIYGWNDKPISFVDLAQSMGMRAERAEGSDEIASAIGDAMAADEPRLIEVPTDPTEPQASTWME